MKRIVTLLVACAWALGCGVPSEPATNEPAAQSTAPVFGQWECPQQQPPPPGPCVYEVSLEELTVTDKQGVTDGNLELSLDSSFSQGAASGNASWSKDKAKEDIGYTVGDLMGTFTVPRGQNRTVTLCHTTTEIDYGWVNGRDDVAQECVTTTLSCPGTRERDVTATTNFCRGNKKDSTGACKNFNGTVKVSWKIRLVDNDGDGVDNEDDFTPDPCDDVKLGEEHQAAGGRASIVYFHMGDGDLNTLVQHVGVDLEKPMEGYEYVVLLIDDPKFLGLTLSDDALKNANLVLSPTEDNFFRAFQEVTSRGYDTDVWLWSHGALDGSGGATTNTLDPAVTIDSIDIATRLNPAVTGSRTVPIRMVYSTVCYHSANNDTWLSVGGKVSGAPRFIGFHPTLAGPFADLWNTGSTYGGAIAGQMATGAHLLAENFIWVQGEASLVSAAAGLSLPAGCNVTDSVFAQNPCAKWYFDDGAGDYLGYNMNGGEYDQTRTGLDNLRFSSQWLLQGNVAVTKFSLIDY